MRQPIFRCDEFEIDTGNQRFLRAGREIDLEPKAFAVLVRLLETPGDLCTRDELLDAVWGHRYVTPSTLNRIIGLARRAFEDEADAPRYIQTVHGAGYRFIGQMEAMAAVEPVQMRFGPPTVARPPSRLEPLIGREAELARVADMLKRGRAVTIQGPGGMGKTQCALEFARVHRDDYPDGVWFFDLAPLLMAEEWLDALAATLSVRMASPVERISRIGHVLTERRALLLLDNCDRIAVGVGAIVYELLRHTNCLKVLATSQQQLQFVGERLLRLPPLGLPAVRHPEGSEELREFAATPAIALLTTRIAAIQPAFTLTEADAPALADLCERLDGMPLALELAAARFAVLSPQQVLDRLAHRFSFLVSDVAGRDARHRTLQTLLEWGYALISRDEQRLLACLSVFVQGWSMDAVTSLPAATGTDPEVLVEHLMGLVAKSLVIVDASERPPRYRLLESVREFALAKLTEAGAVRSARDAQLEYVRQMTTQAHEDMVSGSMQRRIALLAREHGNIEAALEHAVTTDQSSSGLRIVGGLLLYFKAHGEFDLGIRLCNRVLSDAWRDSSRAWGRAMLTFGVMTVHWGGKRDVADEALREATRVAQLTGDTWAEGYGTGFHALWLVDAERLNEAYVSIRRAALIATALDDAVLKGLAGLAEGFLLIALAKLADAEVTLKRARQFGNDVHQQHFIEIYISLAQFLLGKYAQAAASGEAALRAAILVGHIRGIAGSIEIAAYLALRADCPLESARYLSAAARIRDRTGVPLFRFWREPHAACEAQLRIALGQDAFALASAEGAKMREESVIGEVARTLLEYSSFDAWR